MGKELMHFGWSISFHAIAAHILMAAKKMVRLEVRLWPTQSPAANTVATEHIAQLDRLL